jgi:two-component system sensor histidine kinase VicK
VTRGSHDGEHRIEFHLPDKPAQVVGDPYRLEQVVANLLENAIKYSPNGGTIRVALEDRGDVVLLSVSDPGIGIPADQQEHLFERYFRARNVSTHSYGGLGLGLYICRDIVERHHGRIWVESEVGRGSTFHVALPTLGAVPATPPHASERHVH